ncbi:MAG: T9SS type A sorting domain-containing protein, partial [Flavobacteriaceae bacterium]|nr:T9SS type A sorting domain-containing protein [Flavobacteriaceae bacterium]
KASFTADDTTICVGGTVKFKSTSTNSPTSSAWTFQAGSPTLAIDSQVTIQYNNPGKYIVRLIVSNLGGIDTIQKNAYITVHPNPPLPSVKETGTNHLSSNAKYGNQWIYNGTPITGAKDTFYDATQSGGYKVETTDSNGCKSISGTYTFKFFNIGLSTLTDDLNLMVFPNPSKGVFNFTFNQNLNKTCQIVVYDLNGKLLSQMQVQVSKNATSSIDLSHKAAGVYLLEIKDGLKVLGHSKLVVER